MIEATEQPKNRWLWPPALMAGAIAVVVFVVALLVGLSWWLALIVAVVVAPVVPAVLVMRVDTMIGRAVGAGPADENAHARLLNQLDGICLTHGINPPEVLVVTDPHPSAMVFGRSRSDATIVATTGLLDRLSVIETEAVAAHLLGRIRTGDAQVDTIGALFCARLLGPFGDLGTSALAALRGNQRDVVADLEGVRLTRYPPGLIQAYSSIVDAEGRVETPEWIRHLWIDEAVPGSKADWPRVLDDRITVLREI